MKRINRYLEFPETPEECKSWKPFILRHELDRTVLAVAKTRIEGTWRAYCSAVPGENHDLEQEGVLKFGARMREDIARVLFPQFKNVPYSR